MEKLRWGMSLTTGGSITRFIESTCAGRDVVGHFYLFCNVVVYHGCRHRMRNWIRSLDLCYTINVSHIWIQPYPQALWAKSEAILTSGTSFSLRRSLAGNCITSVFNLCSAASPDTGFERTTGLSFADTHGATPWSGRSRETFP